MTGADVSCGYFVTTGEFTPQALEFANANEIKLIDLDCLLGFAEAAGTEKGMHQHGRAICPERLPANLTTQLLKIDS
jgi:hypothetical protein